MRRLSTLVVTLLMLLALPGKFDAQVRDSEEKSVQPTPEMKKLYVALGGDWDTSETRERTWLFPNGGERKGRSHVRLGAGGATLVMEGDSDGSAGPLSYIIVVWWDPTASIYRYFTCFRGAGSTCEVRGTAHWEEDKFVNDYEEIIKGKKMKFKDTFEGITPNSYRLVFAWVKDDGSTVPVIVSKNARRTKSSRE
jgi:hypothetical protein